MTLASIAHGWPAPLPPPQLHAPDGFLSGPVAAALWLLTIVVVGYALRRAARTLDERAVPLMGVMAAFIFAAQMVNFPIAAGTSGHLLGGVLAAVLLGPWMGSLVMACVIAVQALLFSDGGIVVMGANITNMGIVGTLGGYAVYRVVVRLLGGEARARIPAAAIAAWIAVVAGAGAMTAEMIVSGTTTDLTLPVMLGIHAVIGLGEALITAAAIAFIAATRADLFTLRDAGIAIARSRQTEGVAR